MSCLPIIGTPVFECMQLQVNTNTNLLWNHEQVIMPIDIRSGNISID